MKKKIPKFQNVAEEREYWATHSFADHIEDTVEMPLDPKARPGRKKSLTGDSNKSRASRLKVDTYLSKGEGRALSVVAERLGETKNAVIRHGLRAYLLKQCKELGLDFRKLMEEEIDHKSDRP